MEYFTEIVKYNTLYIQENFGNLVYNYNIQIKERKVKNMKCK